MIQRKKVRTYEVQMFCDVENCKGKMIPTGYEIEPLYKHRCEECGYGADYLHLYPTIEYVYDREVIDPEHISDKKEHARTTLSTF